jgi:hypothetical protein
MKKFRFDPLKTTPVPPSKPSVKPEAEKVSKEEAKAEEKRKAL